MRKRYIFFDIDGTLIAGGYGNSYVPESCRIALQKLEEAGHFIAISTGRSQAMAYDIMKELGFHHMVSDGGYGVTIDDELLGITPLNKDDVTALIRECQEKGYPWGLQIRNSTARQVPDDSFYEFTHDIYMPCEVVEGLDPEKCDIIYKAYVACYYPDEFTLQSLKKLPWCRFHKEYFFVEPGDKAFGIRKIIDHFHADVKDVIVFGDALNDMTMFIDDWTCVAMGNACDELKAKADYITDDVDKDGIYNACVHLGLFEE